jgi:hypothetical protein
MNTNKPLLIPNDDTELKLKFALDWLKTEDPFKAAIKLYPQDTSVALWVATYWIDDPIVKAEVNRLQSESSPLDFLPSKAEHARKLYEKAMDDSIDPKVQALYHRLYAEVTGQISKDMGANDGKPLIIQVTGTDLKV